MRQIDGGNTNSIQYSGAEAPLESAPQAQSLADEFSPLDLLWILLRRKWVIVGGIVVFVLAAFLFSLVQRPVYRATASLEIERMNEDFLNLLYTAMAIGFTEKWEWPEDDRL
jgi:uncharacterized protein involved in exopolysaccharide biosynthesis